MLSCETYNLRTKEAQKTKYYSIKDQLINSKMNLDIEHEAISSRENSRTIQPQDEPNEGSECSGEPSEYGILSLTRQETSKP